MDELEMYKNKAMRLEKALRQITDIRWRSYDCMLSTAKCALEEEVRIELERGLTPLAADLPSAVVNHCNPVNGVHASWRTGHETASH